MIFQKRKRVKEENSNFAAEITVVTVFTIRWTVAALPEVFFVC
jgi:hypothetical protein